MDLQRYAIKGSYYSFFVEVFKNALFFVVSLVLARMLYPAHFGLIGIVFCYLQFFSVLCSMGFERAIIHVESDNDDYLSFIFGVLLFVGFFSFLLSFVFAPILVKLLNIRLLAIILPVASVTIISDSLHIIPSALFLKNMDIKSLTFAQALKSILYGSSTLIFAALGFGIWSVIIGLVISSLGSCLYAYMKISWKPRWTLSGREKITHIASNMYLLRILSVIKQNFHVFIIASFLGGKELGLFYFACKAGEFFFQEIFAVSHRVLCPILYKCSSNKEKLNSIVQQAIKYMSLYSLPVYCGLIFGSYHITAKLFGERWIQAVKPLQILSVSYLLSGYNRGIFANVCIAQKKFRFLLTLASIIGLVITPCAVLYGSRFGIVGISYALLFVEVVLFINYALYLFYITKFDWGACIKENLQFVFASILCVLVYKLLEPYTASHAMLLPINMMCSGAVYYLVLRGMGMEDIFFLRKMLQKEEQDGITV